MTEQEKEILAKDLSNRLMYGVIVQTPKGNGYLNSIEQSIIEVKYGVNIDSLTREYFTIDQIKPYLFSLKDMAEEDRFRLACCRPEKYKEIDFYDRNNYDYRKLERLNLCIIVTKENNPYNK